MSDEVMLEIAIGTTDEELLRTVEKAIADADPRRWPGTRDIATIITVTSDITGLISALLTLKAAFDKKTGAPQVSIVIRNESRDEVALSDITEQTARELSSSASPETAG